MIEYDLQYWFNLPEDKHILSELNDICLRHTLCTPLLKIEQNRTFYSKHAFKSPIRHELEKNVNFN